MWRNKKAVRRPRCRKPGARLFLIARINDFLVLSRAATDGRALLLPRSPLPTRSCSFAPGASGAAPGASPSVRSCFTPMAATQRQNRLDSNCEKRPRVISAAQPNRVFVVVVAVAAAIPDSALVITPNCAPGYHRPRQRQCPMVTSAFLLVSSGPVRCAWQAGQVEFGGVASLRAIEMEYLKLCSM